MLPASYPCAAPPLVLVCRRAECGGEVMSADDGQGSSSGVRAASPSSTTARAVRQNPRRLFQGAPRAAHESGWCGPSPSMHDLTPSLRRALRLDPIQAPLPLVKRIGERGLNVSQRFDCLRAKSSRIKLQKILIQHRPDSSMLPIECLVEPGIDSL